MRSLRVGALVAICAGIGGLGNACGGSPGGTGDSNALDAGQVDTDATVFHVDDSGPPVGFTGQDAGPVTDAGVAPGIDVNGPLVVGQTQQAIDIVYGGTAPTVQFTATINGYAVPASFSIDRGEIGSIAASTGVLTATGLVGGTITVTVAYGGQKVTAALLVVLHLVENGAAATVGDAGAGDGGTTGDAGAVGGGAGGNGGVGGEGVGAPVDPTTLAELTSSSDAGIPASTDGGATDGGVADGWLYPYDKTVWPRGLLAPLLQWSTAQSYDAVLIHLSENGFDYQGTFAKTATPFVHHPIPEAAWDLLCNSNQGEAVNVTLTFVSGGKVSAPITESWTIAQGSVTGTVYYNSYGTNLAHLKGYGFGAATLAIKHGATAPELVAGSDTECRVCHSVSADGSHLVTGNGDGNFGGSGENPRSAWYDLKNGNLETALTAATDGRYNWGGLSPDGTMLLSNGAAKSGGVKLQGSAAEDNGPVNAQLYAVATGAAIASSGLPNGLVVGSPAFSPDGKHVVFNFYSGTVTLNASTATADGGVSDAGATDAAAATDAGAAAPTTVKGDGVSLAAMDYDATTSTFSNFRVLFTPPAGYGVWPSFTPTNAAVIFELETLSNGRDWGGTRSSCDSLDCENQKTHSGTQAELWWVDISTKKAARLDLLNGKNTGAASYLPTLPANQHLDDSILNYEPTVNPVPSGGYAWVVFTSRRLYGNVATVPPYWSDPRYAPISATPTTKKLWVAAVDLDGAPGHDISHPAFYLPAQELLGGNSRGYWVVDPCAANGSSCQTGDQCCGGFCSSVNGALTCSAQSPGCSSLNDKCTVDADCCGVLQQTTCINGRCAEPAPPPVTPPATGGGPPK